MYNTFVCMYSDPGVIPRPPDYIEKKAKWEIEQKRIAEENQQKRLEEAKNKFGDMMRVDYDDTPIPMNETIHSDRDTEVDSNDPEKGSSFTYF
jgi:hypothetical protein